jgi:LPS export ABC transporter protein LptC
LEKQGNIGDYGQMRLSFKNPLLILFFTLLMGGVTIMGVVIQVDDDQFDTSETSVGQSQRLESYFKDLHYLSLNEGVPFLELKASELASNSQSQKTTFLSPEGMAFGPDGGPVTYKARTGIYQQGRGELLLEHEVVVSMNTSTLESDSVLYEQKYDRVLATGSVKTEAIDVNTGDSLVTHSSVVSHWVSGNRSEYSGGVSGQLKRRRSYEPGIEFFANKIHFEHLKQYVSLFQDVKIIRQGMTATARNGEIFLENYNKSLKYFTLFDDVKVLERVMIGGKSHKRRAYAERLEGITSENKVTLTGTPKVYQLSDVIKGNRITLRENNEVVEVDDANTNFRLR